MVYAVCCLGLLDQAVALVIGVGGSEPDGIDLLDAIAIWVVGVVGAVA